MISKRTKTQVHKKYIYISVATHEHVSYPNPNDELCGHSHNSIICTRPLMQEL